ncbi:MAG: hypothetical protein ACRESW_04825, partial [Nevskiales bacterium]
MSQAPLSADNAWQWVMRGWQTFTKNPVVLVVFALIYIVSLYLLNLVPVIGSFVAALLSPALIGGFLLGVREVEAGRELKPGQIFSAFQDQAKLVQLGLLGVVPLVITLLQKGVMASPVPQGLAALIGLLLSLACACALLYGLPLVMLGNKQAVEAVPASLRACLGQPLAVGVFLGLAVLLVIVALIPLGLG